MAKKGRGTKEPLDDIQNTKITTSSPIISQQKNGEKEEIMSDFTFLGSKITVEVTAAMKLKDICSLEEKP